MQETPSALIPSEVPAEALLERAVAHCACRRRETPDEALAHLRAGDGEVHSAFRYALAKELGSYLGGLGAAFHAIYVYGSAMGNSASPCSDIDILIVVRYPRDEVRRLLAQLDVSLSCRYRELLGRRETPRTLLDIALIDDAEERERRGIGQILSRMGTCPVCLWRIAPDVPAGASRKGTPADSSPSSARVDEQMLHLARLVDIELDYA